MSLLKEIRNQPEGVRKVMFALSLVTTLSLVGTLWFTSFQRNVYALLNPDTSNTVEERQFAGEDAGPQAQSPFAAIGQVFRDMTANIGQVFGEKPTSEDSQTQQAPSVQSGKAQPLPISR